MRTRHPKHIQKDEQLILGSFKQTIQDIRPSKLQYPRRNLDESKQPHQN